MFWSITIHIILNFVNLNDFKDYFSKAIQRKVKNNKLDLDFFTGEVKIHL